MPYFNVGGPPADSKLNTLSRTLFSLITDSSNIANTTSETDFSKTYTLPANTIDTVGQEIEIECSGSFARTGSPNLTLKIYFAGDLVLQTSALTVSSDGSWHAVAKLTVRVAGASGVVARTYGLAAARSGGVAISLQTGTISKDFTTGLLIKGSAQWSAASSSNTIKMDRMVVKLHTPAAAA